MSTSIRIFSSGQEFRNWRANNCDKCTKDYDWNNYPNEGMNLKCKAEEALSLACVGSGRISKRVAMFIGWEKGKFSWKCPHFKGVG